MVSQGVIAKADVVLEWASGGNGAEALEGAISTTHWQNLDQD